MKRFVAGVVIGVLLGAGAATAISDEGPDRAGAARITQEASGCDDVAQTIRDALARAGQPGVEVTDRAKKLASQVEVGGDDAVLCASDVDVLEP